MQSGVSYQPPLDEGREYLLLLVRALGLVDLLHEGARTSRTWNGIWEATSPPSDGA